MYRGLNHRARRQRSAVLGIAACAPLSAALGWQLGVPALGGVVVVVLALLIWQRAGAVPAAENDDDLRAHLARARRREEPVDVLALRLEGATPDQAAAVRRALRVTDSGCLRPAAGGWELSAIVDRPRLDRDALQSRLAGLAGRELAIGWARFPEDGYTLGVLVSHARAGLDLVPAHAGWEPPDALPELFAPQVTAAPVRAAHE